MSNTISVHNMSFPCSELGILMYNWTFDSMNNLPSYCGLVDAKIRASDKDLPVSTSTLDNSYKNNADEMKRYIWTGIDC